MENCAQVACAALGPILILRQGRSPLFTARCIGVPKEL